MSGRTCDALGALTRHEKLVENTKNPITANQNLQSGNPLQLGERTLRCDIPLTAAVLPLPGFGGDKSGL